MQLGETKLQVGIYLMNSEGELNKSQKYKKQSIYQTRSRTGQQYIAYTNPEKIHLQIIIKSYKRRMDNKTYIIEEDQHLENLRKIIKRDFFVNHPSSLDSDSQHLEGLTLNQYLSKFKSNESQIFTELVKADYDQWKQKNQWMERCSKFMLEGDKEQAKPYTNMLGKNSQLKAIDHSKTNQDGQNGVFFSPVRKTATYLSKQHEEKKKILYSNCSIPNPNIHEQVKYVKNNPKNYELEERPGTPYLEGKGPKIRQESGEKQYSMKRQLSPEPQVMPIMTWGQVESTPQRIQQYSIPETPRRDLVLEEMNVKICKAKKIKKDRKDELKSKILSSVRPNMSSYRKASMQRLDTNKRQPQKKQMRRLDGLLNFETPK